MFFCHALDITSLKSISVALFTASIIIWVICFHFHVQACCMIGKTTISLKSNSEFCKPIYPSMIYGKGEEAGLHVSICCPATLRKPGDTDLTSLPALGPMLRVTLQPTFNTDGHGLPIPSHILYCKMCKLQVKYFKFAYSGYPIHCKANSAIRNFTLSSTCVRLVFLWQYFCLSHAVQPK